MRCSIKSCVYNNLNFKGLQRYGSGCMKAHCQLDMLAMRSVVREILDHPANKLAKGHLLALADEELWYVYMKENRKGVLKRLEVEFRQRDMTVPEKISI